MTPNPREVWVLSDGRPGHFQQSKGLVMALQRRAALNVQWVELSLRGSWSRRLLRLLLNLTHQPLSLAVLGLFYRLPPLPSKSPQLIISAGGDTAMVNIALARLYGARNAFMGSARGLQGRHFSALLTIEPQRDPVNNIVLDLAPTPVDREHLAREGQALRQRLGLAPGQKLLTVLIGGEGAGYHWTVEDWRALALDLSDVARREDLLLLVTTSRRTGVAGEKALSAALAGERVAEAVWYGREPQAVMAAYLGAADYVVCTADSMSMNTEAVAAGKPLLVATPKRAEPDKAFSEALQRFSAAGRLAVVPAEGLAEHWSAIEALQPLQEDPLERTARAVEKALLGD